MSNSSEWMMTSNGNSAESTALKNLEAEIKILLDNTSPEAIYPDEFWREHITSLVVDLIQKQACKVDFDAINNTVEVYLPSPMSADRNILKIILPFHYMRNEEYDIADIYFAVDQGYESVEGLKDGKPFLNEYSDYTLKYGTKVSGVPTVALLNENKGLAGIYRGGIFGFIEDPSSPDKVPGFIIEANVYSSQQKFVGSKPEFLQFALVSDFHYPGNDKINTSYAQLREFDSKGEIKDFERLDIDFSSVYEVIVKILSHNRVRMQNKSSK